MTYKKVVAFTLAEVLITLGIIGVVAAMTMPTLINNYQKKQMVNQLKKAYSEIYNAVKMAEIKQGTMDTWDLSNFETSQERSTYFFDNYLTSINMLKKCAPSSSECWADGVKTLDGTKNVNQLKNDIDKTFSFITTSGYSVFSWVHGNGQGAWFVIDINGLKKPNIAGKDIFPFIFTWGRNACSNEEGSLCRKSGLYPVGMHIKNISYTRDDLKTGGFVTSEQNDVLSKSNCAKGTSMNYAGYFCGSLIMMDDWEIKDDYPW